MWKNGEFPTPTRSSADFPSGPSAAASFSAGPRVGSDNYVRMCRVGNPRERLRTLRAPGLGWVDNAWMAGVQRGETTVGPLALNGRTITLVARTTAVHVGSDARGALRVRSRPAHVEVLDEDGQRHVVHIRNVEQALIAAIAIAGIATSWALRFIRRSTNERSVPRS